MGISAPKKKCLAPPPQIARRHPPSPSPPPLSWENPPPSGIFNKTPTPALSWRLELPLPLPRAERNKKYSKRPPSNRNCCYSKCCYSNFSEIRSASASVYASQFSIPTFSSTTNREHQSNGRQQDTRSASTM